LPARHSLVEKHDPSIVALGFGDVREETLAALGTGAGKNLLAFVDEGTLRPGDLIDSIKTALLKSILKSTSTGEFDVPLPKGMRRVASA